MEHNVYSREITGVSRLWKSGAQSFFFVKNKAISVAALSDHENLGLVWHSSTSLVKLFF